MSVKDLEHHGSRAVHDAMRIHELMHISMQARMRVSIRLRCIHPPLPNIPYLACYARREDPARTRALSSSCTGTCESGGSGGEERKLPRNIAYGAWCRGGGSSPHTRPHASLTSFSLFPVFVRPFSLLRLLLFHLLRRFLPPLIALFLSLGVGLLY